MTISSEIREKAISLRVDSKLSLKKIAKELNIAKSTASLWLKNYPLEPRFKNHAKPNTIAQEVEAGPALDFVKFIKTKKFTQPQLGRIAETAVAFRLALLGLEFYTSPMDGGAIDFIVNIGPRLLKLQVKLASNPKRGSPAIKVRKAPSRNSNPRAYSESEVDFFIGYDMHAANCYVWAFDEISHITATKSITASALERWDKLLNIN